MKLELRHELKLRREDEDEKIINFRLSDEDFELAKQIREEDKQDFLDKLEEKSVELPQDQESLVLSANSAVEHIVGKYGLELPDRFYKTIDIYPLHHADYKRAMFDEEEDQEFVNAMDDDSTGRFIPEAGAVIIRYPKKSYLEKEFQNIKFLDVVAHEIIHAKAYQSLQAFREEAAVQPGGEVKPQVSYYRNGLHILKFGQTEKGFFDELDEAITEALSAEALEDVVNDFDRELFKPLILRQIQKRLESPRKNNPVRDEAIKRGVLKEYGKADEFVQEVFKRGYKFKQEERYKSYSKGRKVLAQIIKAILRKNPDYQDEDKVKKLFYEAYFTGRMLNLGRVIEKTFGKGTFRLMAEDLFGEELQKRLKG